MKKTKKLGLVLLAFAFFKGMIAQESNSSMATNELSSNPCLTNPCYEDKVLKEFEYTGSYLIGDKVRFQSVYSSQNYGSFYEMYMRANYHNGTRSSIVKSFDFIIVNYKGPINLGFADIRNQKNEIYFNKEDGVIGMRLLIRGKNTKNSMRFKVPIEWGITKENVSQLNIFRMLIPLDDLEITGTVKNQVFDSEFYERNGLEINRKPIVPPGHYNILKPDYFGPPIEDIAKRDFFEGILNFKDKQGNNYTITSKDSNCYTSTMIVN